MRLLLASALVLASGADFDSLEVPCFTAEELKASATRTGQDIRDDTLFERIYEAFGQEGPGVLCVHGGGISERVRQIRDEVLPRMVALSDLPEQDLAALLDPVAPGSNGFHRGTEVSDRATSTFHFHPVTSTIARHLPPGVEPDPHFHGKNLWPLNIDMPDLEKDFKNAAQFVVHMGERLAALVDKALDDSVMGYSAGALEKVVKTGSGSNHKARMVRHHPFASGEDLTATGGLWEQPALDTSLLTGIIPAVYLEADGERAKAPDAETGLFVQDRLGGILKVELPKGVEEAIFYRMGEGLQIMSGGDFQAAPFLVKGPQSPGAVSSVSLTVFMRPHPHEELAAPGEMKYEDVAAHAADRDMPDGWPTLAERLDKLKAEPFSSLATGGVLTFGEYDRITRSSVTRATVQADTKVPSGKDHDEL